MIFGFIMINGLCQQIQRAKASATCDHTQTIRPFEHIKVLHYPIDLDGFRKGCDVVSIMILPGVQG